MRSIDIAPDEIYHIYNRGNQKQKLFYSDRDFIRMLFLILLFQSPKKFRNISRRVDYFNDEKDFKVEYEEVIQGRFVELINFCIMPNHFHLTVKNLTDDGIPKYLHRIQNAYGRFFNAKRDKTGHVFQGTYKAKHISSDRQLQYVSAYIHKNPLEISDETSYKSYRWSSYQDYVYRNRWDELLKTGIILDGFQNNTYKNFITSSPAKTPLDI
jgi:putative transposase